MERDIEMLRLAQKQQMTVEQIKASLAAVAIKTRAQADQHGRDLMINSAKDATDRIDAKGEQAASRADEATRAATERAQFVEDEHMRRMEESYKGERERGHEAEQAAQERRYQAYQAEAVRRHEAEQADRDREDTAQQSDAERKNKLAVVKAKPKPQGAKK